jgi:ArsR family metal-binding transcriptional regulator
MQIEDEKQKAQTIMEGRRVRESERREGGSIVPQKHECAVFGPQGVYEALYTSTCCDCPPHWAMTGTRRR